MNKLDVIYTVSVVAGVITSIDGAVWSWLIKSEEPFIIGFLICCVFFCIAGIARSSRR